MSRLEMAKATVIKLIFSARNKSLNRFRALNFLMLETERLGDILLRLENIDCTSMFQLSKLRGTRSHGFKLELKRNYSLYKICKYWNLFHANVVTSNSIVHFENRLNWVIHRLPEFRFYRDNCFFEFKLPAQPGRKDFRRTCFPCIYSLQFIIFQLQCV